MPAHKKNLVGSRFGKLVVLEEATPFTYESGYKETTWLCKCDCGKTDVVRAKCLLKGSAASCGCSAINVIKFLGNEASLRALYQDYIGGARQRALVFDLTLEDFRVLTSQNCRYCGAEPSKRSRARKGTKIPYIYNGVDRIDNEFGYTKENSAPCCSICNRMKFKFSVEEFIEHARRITEHNSE